VVAAAVAAAAAGAPAGTGDGTTSTPPGGDDWLQSPYPLQCMCFLVVARALAVLVFQRADTHSDNSSSSSRCPDGSFAAAATAAATASRQQHARRSQKEEEEEEDEKEQQGQQEWLPRCLARVPRAYAALLDAIGCSREVALWAAHTFSPGSENDYDILDVVRSYYTQYVYVWMQRRGLEQPEQQLHHMEYGPAAERQQVLQQYIAPAAKQQQQQQQSAFQREPLDLHLWLSVSLLQWVVDMPSSDPDFTQCYWRAAECATRFLSLSSCELAFEQVWLHTLTAQQQQLSSPVQTPQQQVEQQQCMAEPAVQGDLSESQPRSEQQLDSTPTSIPGPDSPQEGAAPAAVSSQHSITAAAQVTEPDFSCLPLLPEPACMEAHMLSCRLLHKLLQLWHEALQATPGSTTPSNSTPAAQQAGGDQGGPSSSSSRADDNSSSGAAGADSGGQEAAAAGDMGSTGCEHEAEFGPRGLGGACVRMMVEVAMMFATQLGRHAPSHAAAAAASGEDTATVTAAAGRSHAVAASAAAATAAAGDVCAVLEAVVRTELTAAAQLVNNGTSSTCGDVGNDAGMLSGSLRSLPDYILAEDAFANGWKVGPLVDPFAFSMLWPTLADASPSPLRQQQQEQLYGLLFTALKLTAVAPQQGPTANVFSFCRMHGIKPICKAASSIIHAGMQQQQRQQQQESQNWQEGVFNNQTAAAAAAASSSSVTGSIPAAADSIAANFAADMLPCLAILGRGCLCCAEEMQRLQEGSYWEALMLYTCKCCLRGVATTLRHVLSSGSVVKQLDLLGYQDVTRHLTQQLETVEDFLMRLTEQRNAASDTYYMDAETRGTMQQLHQSLGSTLTRFAVPHACNNLHCRNVSGRSEAQLVGGRSCICGGCRTARYCSRACQAQHWKQHKPVCRALAAAAVAAAGGGSGASAGSGQVRC